MKNMPPGKLGSNVLYFVVFVWLQSSVGLIIFMTLCVSFFLAITVPVLAMIPSFDSSIEIFPEDTIDSIEAFCWGTFWAYLLLPFLLHWINDFIVWFCFTTKELKHQVITRNRFFFMWYETAAMLIYIPLVTTKFIGRFVLMVLSGLVYMSRADVSLLVKGQEHRDPAFRSYISFLLNDHAISNPVLVSFCRALLRCQKLRNAQSKGPRREDSDVNTSLVQVADGEDDKDAAGAGASGMTEAERVSARARTRWFLLLTLSRNPTLIWSRKHKLIAKEKGKSRLKSAFKFAKTHGARGFRASVAGVTVVGRASKTMLQKRLARSSAGSDEVATATAQQQQQQPLVVHVIDRKQAEGHLRVSGVEGGYLLRGTSQQDITSAGTVAMSYLAQGGVAIHHKFVAQEDGTFTLDGKPGPWTSLEEVVSQAKEQAGQTRGLVQMTAVAPGNGVQSIDLLPGTHVGAGLVSAGSSQILNMEGNNDMAEDATC